MKFLNGVKNDRSWDGKMKRDSVKNENYIDFDKQDEVEIESILRIIYRAKFAILAFLVLGVLGANWYVSRKPVAYSSSIKFSQNNKNIALFEENTANLVNSDYFKQKLIKDTDIKEKYAQAYGVKDINSVKDSDISSWIKSAVSVSFVRNTGYEGSFTDINVITTTDNKDMAYYLAQKYYEVLGKVLNERRTQYADRKVKYLEQKVELLRSGKSTEQVLNNSQNGNNVLSAYEQAMNDLAEAKLLKTDYRELLTLISNAQPAYLLAKSKMKYTILGAGGGIFMGVFLVFIWDIVRAISWKRVTSK
jgi:uncharacterized protein involved in exopolysaccharide biosynthesis